MSELRIQGNQTRIPGGGNWKAHHPETGVLLKAGTMERLSRKMKEYCRENNLPIGLNFEQDLEKAVCKEQPTECEQIVAGQPLRPHRMYMSDIVRGTEVMARFKLGGSNVVESSEASRRAAICQHCPLNTHFIRPCSGICSQLKRLAVSLVGKQIDLFPGLEACSICHCLNGLSVWLAVDIQWEAMTDTMREQFKAAKDLYGCWKVM